MIKLEPLALEQCYYVINSLFNVFEEYSGMLVLKICFSRWFQVRPLLPCTGLSFLFLLEFIITEQFAHAFLCCFHVRTFLKNFCLLLRTQRCCALIAAPGLHSGRGEGGAPPGCAGLSLRRLLGYWSHGLCGRGLQRRGLSGCGSRALKRRHMRPAGTRESLLQGARGSFLDQGWSPVFCLDSGFFTTEPPGKP